MADIHWGVMDAIKQYQELRCVTEYLDENEIDLLVICGDYFDHKLMLNSQASILSIKFMNELRMRSLNDKHPFKIRIFKGTHSHDYDQLEVFKPLDDGDTFRVFTTTTVEETLPGLKCLYAPDELINTDDYMDLYYEETHEPNDFMFFHGNFDVQLGGLLDRSIENVIFSYDHFSSISHVMIGGHWHDAEEHENMYYTRSVNRWMFGEFNPKGFIVCEYNTEDPDNYNLWRIINRYTDTYLTFTVDTSLYKTTDDYSNLINEITERLDTDDHIHIRVKIVITNEADINKTFIESIKLRYSNDRRVKVTVEDKVSKTKKKEKSESNSYEKNTYAFLFDRNKSVCDKIKEYIRITKHMDITEADAEKIANLLSAYNK